MPVQNCHGTKTHAICHHGTCTICEDWGWSEEEKAGGATSVAELSKVKLKKTLEKSAVLLATKKHYAKEAAKCVPATPAAAAAALVAALSAHHQATEKWQATKWQATQKKKADLLEAVLQEAVALKKEWAGQSKHAITLDADALTQQEKHYLYKAAVAANKDAAEDMEW